MSEAPIKATLKAGRDFDAPWVTVDGHDPADLKFKLDGLIEAGAFESVVNAANLLKGVNNVATVAAEVASPPQAAAPAWSAPAQQQAPAPSWATGTPQAAPVQQGGALVTGSPHPEGIRCPVDQQVVLYKDIYSKAKQKSFQMWSCPNQRSRDDGHYSEFAN